MNIKDIVKDQQQVEFVRYQAGELWYRADNGFEFPVPITEAGSGAFMPKDKAILFMRWIKPHLDSIQAAKVAAMA